MVGVTGLAMAFLMVATGGIFYLIYQLCSAARQARVQARPSTDLEASSGNDADESSMSTAEGGVAKRAIPLKNLKKRRSKSPKKSTEV